MTTTISSAAFSLPPRGGISPVTEFTARRHSYDSVKRSLTPFFYTLRDKSQRVKYHEFYNQKRSNIFLLYTAIVTAVVFLPLTFLLFFADVAFYSHSKDSSLLTNIALSAVMIVLVIVWCVTSWMLSVYLMPKGGSGCWKRIHRNCFPQQQSSRKKNRNNSNDDRSNSRRNSDGS